MFKCIFFLNYSNCCLCSLKNTRFRNKAPFNMDAEFSSIERLRILNITDSWQKSAKTGNVAPSTRWRYKHFPKGFNYKKNLTLRLHVQIIWLATEIVGKNLMTDEYLCEGVDRFLLNWLTISIECCWPIVTFSVQFIIVFIDFIAHGVEKVVTGLTYNSYNKLFNQAFW